MPEISAIPDPLVVPTSVDGHNVDPPYLHVLIAGGLGGSIADFIMHSVDTVKTRLQGQPFPPKYENMFHAYRTILREEGVTRGLYSGIGPAMTGSIPGTTIYFGTYEFVKRTCIEKGVPESASHLAAGAIGDLAASIIYVPSEVLKTRMQLQGRYNNPNFTSGYNYKNSLHALKMIVKYDGFRALYNGFRATILRDVPFSALQFAFYEKLKKVSLNNRADKTKSLSLPTEIGIGALAGGAAGAITTPLDVMKTLLQTQVKTTTASKKGVPHKYYTGIIDGLIWNYRQEGIKGLFRGIGPRVFWTALQSGGMFVIYEQVLLLLDNMQSVEAIP
ncbi:mitochondrial carrier [Basidiobolus meristosporus CBS 931.73]|uniref:Mitochondrial carrier n=1 Tax=Basidiobolus meristosporus CBS 931.73 TaxID=1314790 RepID=A0A1Y1Z6L8_9FUNG|nr:mitochondrial carrier [Basidiobolus meristosporus CBS 931.73]|eukprot:ORY05637.1 mitochondrial carrier [Basidiobolus meristosporus CBS 931.73]